MALKAIEMANIVDPGISFRHIIFELLQSLLSILLLFYTPAIAVVSSQYAKPVVRKDVEKEVMRAPRISLPMGPPRMYPTLTISIWAYTEGCSPLPTQPRCRLRDALA